MKLSSVLDIQRRLAAWPSDAFSMVLDVVVNTPTFLGPKSSTVAPTGLTTPRPLTVMVLPMVRLVSRVSARLMPWLMRALARMPARLGTRVWPVAP